MTCHERREDIDVVLLEGVTMPCRGCGAVRLRLRRVEDGKLLRLELTRSSVAFLRGAMQAHEEFKLQARVNSQSARSSGRSQPEGSMPDDGQTVAPETRSSSA